MARKTNTGGIIGSSQITWKRRPSEIRGYQRALYVNTEQGDYLRVDYNLKDKKVRLYIEDAEEGGSPYYAVIVNGKISVERNVSSGRPCSLGEKLGQRADYFSDIANRQVISLIGGNYGIKGGNKRAQDPERTKKRKEELEKTKKRYFRPEYSDEDIERMDRQRAGRIRIVDFIDLLLGLGLCGFLYFYFRSFTLVGIAAGAYGILMGAVDVLIRSRNPILVKVLLFVLGGLASYVYGYYFM